jgi:DNA-binding NtrC family response regulator
LENAVEHAVVMTDPSCALIGAEALPELGGAPSEAVSPQEQDPEGAGQELGPVAPELARALDACAWNMGRAAQQLGETFRCLRWWVDQCETNRPHR